MANRKITALKIQKRNPNRLNVYLDGEYAFGLSRIVAVWLQVGQNLSEERIVALNTEDENEVAFQRALRLISYRTRSRAEVQHRLKEKGVSEEVVNRVLERLTQSGIIDDRNFAQTWVENRSAFRPRSRRVLASELRQKGVALDVISETLETIAQDDEELAYQAAQNQSRKLKYLEWPEFRRKLGGFLARRGFSYSTIAPVVQRVWTEQGSTGPAEDNLT